MGLTLDEDIRVLNYWPHAHLRATAARYTAFYPDGRTELLLDVPRYDQSWQVTYKYTDPKLLPKCRRGSSPTQWSLTRRPHSISRTNAD